MICKLKNFSVDLNLVKTAKVIDKTLIVIFTDKTEDRMQYETEKEASDNYNKLVEDLDDVNTIHL